MGYFPFYADLLPARCLGIAMRICFKLFTVALPDLEDFGLTFSFLLCHFLYVKGLWYFLASLALWWVSRRFYHCSSNWWKTFDSPTQARSSNLWWYGYQGFLNFCRTTSFCYCGTTFLSRTKFLVGSYSDSDPHVSAKDRFQLTLSLTWHLVPLPIFLELLLWAPLNMAVHHKNVAPFHLLRKGDPTWKDPNGFVNLITIRTELYVLIGLNQLLDLRSLCQVWLTLLM